MPAVLIASIVIQLFCNVTFPNSCSMESPSREPSEHTDEQPAVTLDRDAVIEAGRQDYRALVNGEESGRPNLIADLFEKSGGLLRMALPSLRISEPTAPHDQLKDSLTALHLWGLGHGVSSGNLDPALQASILYLLASIAEFDKGKVTSRRFEVALTEMNRPINICVFQHA
ncbi:hypothetical protein BCR34DRAFT_583280 [Clohesyomyces aquaticus]|uniref:Uncharacterized protein n=1 Tax=Clohesyomyces aquaticus TaxID=1231657 RepID=A0A1Y2A7K8_9PLEO|nr:hypothetical protein BCR34DRAFT_583280 [Clohesyomyces aquaticus]